MADEKNARRALNENAADAVPLLGTSLGIVKQEVKDELDDEVLNPLDMDMEDEDLLVSDTMSSLAKSSLPNHPMKPMTKQSPLLISTFLHQPY